MADCPNPPISIITPCLNAEPTLREAVESVNFPSTGEVEHLLIDARSTDGTLAEASRYPYLKVLSETDAGIYDGMNKGARFARGEWLLFLQADDWLPLGTLQAYLDAIASYPDAQMICGGAEAVRKEGAGWKRVWSVSGNREKELTVGNIALGEPMINARLIRRDVFLALGGFSLEYKLASDRDFLLRAAEQKIRQQVIEAPAYRYRWHAGSSTMTAGNHLSARLLGENILIAKRHLNRVPQEEKPSVRNWHTRLHVQGAMNALESGDVTAFLGHAAGGLSSDPLWFLDLLGEIVRSLPGFLARGGRTRSQILRSKPGAFE
jgi:glycosyltransferase